MKTGLKWRCKKTLTTHAAPVTCLKYEAGSVSRLFMCQVGSPRGPPYSWAVLKLLTSVHLGKIDDLHNNGKSYNIFNYFFMEKHKILLQFDDLTS